MQNRKRNRPTPGRSGESDHQSRGTRGPTTDEEGSGHPSRRLHRFLLALALAGLTMAVYGQVGHHDFVSLDDTAYVTENEHVAGGLTGSGLVWAITAISTQAANWHPVTWLSHMLDIELFGMNAGAHHMVSAVLHTLNALVLFLLLDGMTGRPWRSACVAALFAVHPLHVESVAWISERKDVLSTLFWFLTTWAYVRYTRQPGRVRWTVVLLLFVLGLMAKPMLVTLPFTLLLLDWWPLNRVPGGAPAGHGATSARWRHWAPLIVEKWPLFALAALSSVITIVAQRQGGAVVTMETIPVPARAANAALSYVAYMWQMVWPSGLSVFYQHSGGVPVASTAAALVLLVGMSVVAARAARRRPHVAVGWFWYLGTLAPVIGLVQVGMQARADRYTYVPLIGLFVAIVWECAERVGTRALPRMAASAAACLIIGACGMTARAQVGYWADDTSLWAHALDVNPDNYYAHYSLGRMNLQNGRVNDATPHLERALQLAPWFAEVHDTMGLAWARGGQIDAAIAEHLEALRLKPGLLAARFNLGLAYEQRGDFGGAADQYREALRRDPQKASFHVALGHVLAMQGQLDAAIGELREALRLQPDSAPAHSCLGSVLADIGQTDQAVAELRKALTAMPHFTSAHSLLGTLLLKQGHVNEALDHLSEVVRLEPDSAVARATLGSALTGNGRLDEAIAQYGEAVRLVSGDPGLRNSFGLCLARKGRIADAVAQFSEALRLQPESDATQVRLGMALAATGDLKGGAAHLREALRINPDNQDARTGLQMLARVGGVR